jgi:hypothetical protein
MTALSICIPVKRDAILLLSLIEGFPIKGKAFDLNRLYSKRFPNNETAVDTDRCAVCDRLPATTNAGQ